MAREAPDLVPMCRGGVVAHVDSHRLATDGILVSFSQRGGGVSAPPYGSLNLAAHVGDEARAVDENRSRYLCALGIGDLRDRLITAEQVHGTRVATVGSKEAGSGAWADGRSTPIEGCDALLTRTPGVPLMLFFADCVPVVLAAIAPLRAVCVVHAGWRGTADDVAGRAVDELARTAGCSPSDMLAYIGPHIRSCHYEVGPEVMARFGDPSGTVKEESATMRAARFALDLSSAVRESLARAGVAPGRVVEIEACTAESTDRYFSYRAEGRTGRHAALAAVLDISG